MHWLARARDAYRVALSLAPDLAEAHLGLGRSYTLGGEDVREGVASLESAHRLLPANLEIRLALAKAYAETEGRDEAKDLLARVAAFSHPGPRLDEALELLEQLEAAEAKPARGTDSPQRSP